MVDPVAPEKTPAEPTIFERARAAPITFAITAVNIGVFLWAEHGERSTQETGTLLQFGAVEPLHVWVGQYWRVATCMFLHIGWVHLIWNTYASVGWSTTIERALGKPRFLFVYLLSGIGGGCASVVGGMIFGPRVSAGASGAMFGIIGATLALRRRQLPSFAAFFKDPGIRSTMISIGIWTAIGLTALHMDNSAHFGGLVVGFSATWLLSSPRPRNGWLAFAFGLAAVFTVAARPWWTPSGEELNRLLAFSKAYTSGFVVDERGERKPWPSNAPLGVALLEKGCNSGAAPACRALADHIELEGTPDAHARADALLRRSCELEPGLCQQIH